MSEPLHEDPARVVDPAFSETVAEWSRYVAAEATRRLSTAVADGDAPGGEGYRRRAERTIRQVLDEAAQRALGQGRPVLDAATEQAVTRRAAAQVCGLGPLQELLDEPEIENINLTGTDVWVRYADGRREQRPPVVADDEELMALVRRIAADSPSGERRFDPTAPILDMPLADGSRLNAIMEVAHAPVVSIRRHRYRTTTLGRLRRLGTLDDVAVALLRAAVRARRNIVITGGTGAGKTTLLRALAAEIGSSERIVTIEDVAELGLQRDRRAHPDAVALHARPPNVEGAGEVTVAELVRAALRMSPDRVIVGETRGSETVPLLNAMSQGNDGSLTTVHAASSEGAFAKLGAYAAQSAERLPLEATALLVATAVHLVVHISATPAGERVVTSVREVVGAEGRRVVSNEIYRRARDGGLLPAAPPSPDTIDALAENGFDISRLVGGEARGWAP
ncbi:Flp pilus assembly CpaF family ATPase [Spinactinospora alkalitolerans]|uniref:Flp pilus assembly CpaF family ATPase n=1 Tax=Spinactinospora alkalitolerans TaxID=687207 RepID=A0A852TZM2_9ACTN|nr:ATPase, T2SS/T4P/T4SS family [Spinactinospora alkalitolerans]NYE50026.1 Flp pilus assembly CpaF family ATPase [Spinactinospora alkalitolerans]